MNNTKQDIKENIIVYATTCTSKTITLSLPADSTLLDLEKMILQKEYREPDQHSLAYQDYEDKGVRAGLYPIKIIDRTTETLLDDPTKTLSEYNIVNESRVAIKMAMSRQAPILQCTAANVKFATTYNGCGKNIADFRSKLSKWVGLPCKKILIKRARLGTYEELKDTDGKLPYIDLYAEFEGVINIEPQVDAMKLYTNKDGLTFASSPRETVAQQNGERKYYMFDLPTAENIKVVPMIEGVTFATPKAEIDAIVRRAKACTAFKTYSLFAGGGSLAVEGAQYLLSGTASDKTIASLFITSFGVALVSGIAAAGYSYLQDVYAKRADSSKEQHQGTA